jgi:hypothetical protein
MINEIMQIIQLMKMKKLMTLLFVVICSSSYAQTANNDTIVKIDDTKISAKIITVNEREITFSYPEETVIITLSKNLIKEIIFSGGRKESCNNVTIPVINDEDDWEKVTLTYDASEVEGLVKKGDIVVFETKKITYQPGSYMEAKVIEEAKKQAAELGAPILYAIVPVTSHEGTEFRFLGIAYSYY